MVKVSYHPRIPGASGHLVPQRSAAPQTPPQPGVGTAGPRPPTCPGSVRQKLRNTTAQSLLRGVDAEPCVNPRGEVTQHKHLHAARANGALAEIKTDPQTGPACLRAFPGTTPARGAEPRSPPGDPTERHTGSAATFTRKPPQGAPRKVRGLSNREKAAPRCHHSTRSARSEPPQPALPSLRRPPQPSPPPAARAQPLLFPGPCRLPYLPCRAPARTVSAGGPPPRTDRFLERERPRGRAAPQPAAGRAGNALREAARGGRAPPGAPAVPSAAPTPREDKVRATPAPLLVSH